MVQADIVDVIIKDNSEHKGTDVIGQIDKGGIFYITHDSRVFMSVHPEVILEGIHAHDKKGNKYAFCGTFEKISNLYKDRLLVDSRIQQLKEYTNN